MPRFVTATRSIAVACAAAWTAGCGEPPVVTEVVPDMTVFIGDTATVDLSGHFSDPDGDALTYEASSSDPAVVAASATGSTLMIVPQAKGAASVGVTATDGGGEARIEISVTVGNRAPEVVVPITGIEPYPTEVVLIPVSEHIVDPDGDPVSYEASSLDSAIILFGLSGDTLRVEGVSRGQAIVTVAATDDDGLSANIQITVTVVPMPQRIVLEHFYDAAGGAGWGKSDNWGTDADLATWYGVELNQHGQIRSLSLGGNNLKGTITPHLAELDSLQHLNLESNGLEGTVPELLAWLPLSELRLTDNPGLGGELEEMFMWSLIGLNVFLAGGTDICAPNDEDFRAWLRDIAERRVKMCGEQAYPGAYLIQATQTLEADDRVPLVGGKKALLRVFATSAYSTHEGMPPAKVTFYEDGSEFRTLTVPGRPEAVPTGIAEDALDQSLNMEIPPDVIRPGLEMAIEIDPEGTLDDELGVAARVPAKGVHEYEVHYMPTFDLTVIPFLWEDDPDSAIIGYAERMEEDREEYGLLHATYDLLPVEDFEVTAYKAVETSSNVAGTLLRETDAIRQADGGAGYFQGQMSGDVAGNVLGVAWLNHRSSFSVPRNYTIAHELGHNLNLRHAPCGNPAPAGPDPNYPHENAKTGTWGYDGRNHEMLDPDRYRDMMSYCGPEWISDFFFDKALQYRRNRGYQERRTPAAATQTILLWGGLDEDGEPFLDPAFVMEAFPGLPTSPGAYELTGRDRGGTALFSLSFDMPEVGDAPGKSSSFVFTLPVREGWSSLATVTLSGPGGSVALDGDTDNPMTIAREGKSGPIRAFWDGWRASADRAGRVLLRSRGIPGPEEWRR